MLGNLNKEVFYPYPPQRVWQVLTNRRALAAWLMENDFEPRVGHKFRFQESTLPGLDESIDLLANVQFVGWCSSQPSSRT